MSNFFKIPLDNTKTFLMILKNLFMDNSSVNFRKDDALSRKIDISDKFHTYRVRMARLSAVQASYLFDFRSSISKDFSKNSDLFGGIASEKAIVNDAKHDCEDVFFYYRTIFFGSVQYGFNPKNKKIDEIYAIRLMENWRYRAEEVDRIIKNFLREDWNIQRLDPIMRAILRIATTEAVISKDEATNSVIISEYTNIAANFFTAKMIGFANGIIENITKFVRESTKN